MQDYKFGQMEGYHGDEHLIFDCEQLEDDYYNDYEDEALGNE